MNSCKHLPINTVPDLQWYSQNVNSPQLELLNRTLSTFHSANDTKDNDAMSVDRSPVICTRLPLRPKFSNDGGLAQATELEGIENPRACSDASEFVYGSISGCEVGSTSKLAEGSDDDGSAPISISDDDDGLEPEKSEPACLPPATSKRICPRPIAMMRALYWATKRGMTLGSDAELHFAELRRVLQIGKVVGEERGCPQADLWRFGTDRTWGSTNRRADRHFGSRRLSRGGMMPRLVKRGRERGRWVSRR